MDLIKILTLNYLRFNKPKVVKEYLKYFEESGKVDFELDKELLNFGEHEFDLAKKIGVRIIPFYDEEFPKALLNIKLKPLVLYVFGKFEGFPKESVAIVGSRKCSQYGKTVSYKLSFNLAKLGITIISGLAYGVDANAHKGALDANGKTIAVLGNGVDVVYPKDHVDLAKRIAENSFLVSEFPLGSRPVKYNFPFRNRLISGLSLATIVVEAEVKSGSLITAMHAIEQGKEVFAVPGNITSPLSAGTNALIRDGAIPLLDVEDVLSNVKELNHLIGIVKMDLPTDEEKKVLDLIEDGLTFDSIKERVDMEETRLFTMLTLLEIRGFVRKSAGRYFKT